MTVSTVSKDPKGGAYNQLEEFVPGEVLQYIPMDRRPSGPDA